MNFLKMFFFLAKSLDVIIFINRYDINGDGVVNLEEFLVIMRQIWIYHLLNKTCSKVGPINL